MLVSAAMLTDRGLVRSTNEDAVAYVIPQGGDFQTAPALAILADGMGGHAAGEIASALAIETVLAQFFRGDQTVAAALEAGFAAANDAILDRAATDPGCAGMGTTCTAIALSGADAYLAHIGDSRAYLLSDGRFSQISEDHSVVAGLLRDGMISADEARTHPDRHAILQALGTAREIFPQYWKSAVPLRGDDRFLLCSDGLSDLVDAAAMAQALQQLSPPDACRALVEAAMAAGGHDNISVGVIALQPSGPAAAARITRPQQLDAAGEVR